MNILPIVSSSVTRLHLALISWPEVTVDAFEWGGWSYFVRGKEFARLLQCGLLDIHVTPSDRVRLVNEGHARAHRFWPDEPWVTVSVDDDDSNRALAFLLCAYKVRWGRAGRGRLTWPPVSIQETGQPLRALA